MVCLSRRGVCGKASNPEMMQGLMAKLGAMEGMSSDYMEDLPKKVVRRVKALKQLQAEAVALEVAYQREIQKLDRLYAPQFDAVYAKRSLIVKGEYEPTDEESVWCVLAESPRAPRARSGTAPSPPTAFPVAPSAALKRRGQALAVSPSLRRNSHPFPLGRTKWGSPREPAPPQVQCGELLARPTINNSRYCFPHSPRMPMVAPFPPPPSSSRRLL